MFGCDTEVLLIDHGISHFRCVFMAVLVISDLEISARKINNLISEHSQSCIDVQISHSYSGKINYINKIEMIFDSCSILKKTRWY